MKVSAIQSCSTLCNPMNCSLTGSSVPGILQARRLEWDAKPGMNSEFEVTLELLTEMGQLQGVLVPGPQLPLPTPGSVLCCPGPHTFTQTLQPTSPSFGSTPTFQTVTLCCPSGLVVPTSRVQSALGEDRCKWAQRPSTWSRRRSIGSGWSYLFGSWY